MFRENASVFHLLERERLIETGREILTTRSAYEAEVGQVKVLLASPATFSSHSPAHVR